MSYEAAKCWAGWGLCAVLPAHLIGWEPLIVVTWLVWAVFGGATMAEVLMSGGGWPE